MLLGRHSMPRLSIARAGHHLPATRSSALLKNGYLTELGVGEKNVTFHF